MMEVRVSHEAGYELARTVGRIDDSAAGAFREALAPLLGKAGTNVVLDLSQSNFVSSRGIGHLVMLAAHANTNGSRVILADCPPFIAIVLGRCQLDRFFEIADSVPEAVQRLTAHAGRPSTPTASPNTKMAARKRTALAGAPSAGEPQGEAAIAAGRSVWAV